MDLRRWLLVAGMASVVVAASVPAAGGVAPDSSVPNFHTVFHPRAAGYVGVSCVRVGLCLAVGGRPAVLSGGRWRQLSGASPDALDSEGVSCVPSGQCMAVGSGTYAQLVTLRPGTVQWQPVAMPPAPGFSESPFNSSVDCVRKNWCIAVGEADKGDATAATISVWNGHRWRSRAKQDPHGHYLQGVSVSCWAVGECRIGALSMAPYPILVRSHILRWSHGRLTDSQPFGGDRIATDFPDVTCTSADHCISLGLWASYHYLYPVEQTAIWNGSKWIRRDSHFGGPQHEKYEPTPISCLGPRLCVTAGAASIGNTDMTAIQVLSGRHWTRRSIEHDHASATYYDITCASATSCVLVGRTSKRVGGRYTFAGYIQMGHISR